MTIENGTGKYSQNSSSSDLDFEMDWDGVLNLLDEYIAEDEARLEACRRAAQVRSEQLREERKVREALYAIRLKVIQYFGAIVKNGFATEKNCSGSSLQCTQEIYVNALSFSERFSSRPDGMDPRVANLSTEMSSLRENLSSYVVDGSFDGIEALRLEEGIRGFFDGRYYFEFKSIFVEVDQLPSTMFKPRTKPLSWQILDLLFPVRYEPITILDERARGIANALLKESQSYTEIVH